MKRLLILSAVIAMSACGCVESASRDLAGPAGEDIPYLTLVAALRSGQPPLQAVAAETFMEADRRPPIQDVEALADARDPRVRTTAVALIGTMRQQELVPLLQRKGRDADGAVRLAADFALAMTGEPGRVTALRDALASPNITLRRTAAWLLGLMGNRTAVGMLKLKLDDPDAVVVLRTAEAMHRLGSKDGLARVRTLTGHERHQIRYYATRLLGRMGEESDIPRLVRLCQSRFLDVKFAAIAALAQRGDLKRIGMLLDLAEAPEPDTRVLAIRELGETGYTPAIERLAKLLRSRLPRERTAAAASIVRIRSARAFWRTKILADQPADGR